MIPKKIHTFWLSEGDVDDFAKQNMLTWKQYNPDWEIIVHRSDEFVELYKTIPYYKYTIDTHQWAYATDYLRSKVLYEQGGWYMDADATCHKPLDELIEKYPRKRYLSKESTTFCFIECGSMGFEPNDELMKHMVDYYENWKPNAGMAFMPQALYRVSQIKRIDIGEIFNSEILSGILCENGKRILTPIELVRSKYLNGDYKSVPNENSYTNHHFSHTGY